MEKYINQIINTDCLDILKELPDKCIDLVLTDPPYGLHYDKIAAKNSGKIYKNAATKKNVYRFSDWDYIPEKIIFEEIFRVSKNQIIFGAEHLCLMFPNSRGWLVWDKHTGENRFSDCELAWTSFDKPIKKYDFVWSGMIQQNMKNKEIRIHPTQKPCGLFKKILNDFSSENDLILDCFSGSGTTAIACSDLKRRFICIEKDFDYWQKSLERLENFKKQLTFNI